MRTKRAVRVAYAIFLTADERCHCCLCRLKLLEAGCGTANYSHTLASTVGEVVGLEYSEVYMIYSVSANLFSAAAL
eukprot:SAG31_NODE_402_length_16197_cov_5.262425_1_plen_76_part_00